MCEDYRAASTIEAWYDALAVWRGYCAAEVSGGAVNSGHYLAEEAPEEVLGRLTAFFAA